jgi:hypothetical protein
MQWNSVACGDNLGEQTKYFKEMRRDSPNVRRKLDLVRLI